MHHNYENMKLMSSYLTWTIIFTQVISIILPISLATGRCSNCLDGKCQRSGRCIQGCIDGFADRNCQHKCQSTCKDAKCQLDKKTGTIICLSGCEDGHCGQQCKAPCLDGCLNCDSRTCTCPRCTGDKCQHSCLDGCSLCDKGQCLFCKDGLHGRNCEETCGSKCIRCKQETGKCIKCQQGFHGDSCDQVSTEKTIESKTSVQESIKPESTEYTYHQPDTSTATISTPSSPLLTTSSVKSSSSPATTASASSTTSPTTTSVDEPTQSAYKTESIQLFSGTVGTIIAVLLFVLVGLKLRFLCRRTAVTLTGDHQDDVQHGVVELLEVPHIVHPGLYCEINEEEMDTEMPVLADCFHNRASSDSEVSDDVMDNASNYAHLHNIDSAKLEYLSPSD